MIIRIQLFMTHHNIISYRLRSYLSLQLSLQSTYRNINILNNIFPFYIINQDLILRFEEQKGRIELVGDIFL